MDNQPNSGIPRFSTLEHVDFSVMTRLPNHSFMWSEQQSNRGIFRIRRKLTAPIVGTSIFGVAVGVVLYFALSNARYSYLFFLLFPVVIAFGSGLYYIWKSRVNAVWVSVTPEDLTFSREKAPEDSVTFRRDPDRTQLSAKLVWRRSRGPDEMC